MMSDRLAFVGSMIFGAALWAALFFHGSNPFFLGLTLLVTTAWLAIGIAGRPASTPLLELPRSTTLLALGALYAWLLISLAWSPMPHGSAMTFWGLALFPLATFGYLFFRRYSELNWGLLWGVVALTAVVSALYAVQQSLSGEVPRSLFVNKNNHAAFLNLVAISASGYLLIATGRKRIAALAAVLFLTALAIFLTGSRGALLGLAVGLLFVMSALRLPPHRVRFSGVLATLAVAFLAANQLEVQGLEQRLLSLSDPTAAGSTRFVIWESTLELIAANPWLGSGLGSFYLVYPTVRGAADTSGGFFAHNDFLQFWSEAGLPAFALLVLMWTLAFLRFGRTMLRDPRSQELAGLAGGLAAIVTHSLFTFNFYIPAIMLVLGLFLGRALVLSNGTGEQAVWRPMAALGVLRGRAVPGALALLAMAYFGSMTLSAFYLVQAGKVARAGDWIAARNNLITAGHLAPRDENIWLARANLGRDALINTSNTDQAAHRQVYEMAKRDYQRAIELNVYRPEPWSGLASLEWRLSEAPDSERVQRHFEHALIRDPTHLNSRIAYALYLRGRSDTSEALRILEEGASHAYPQGDVLAAYYSLKSELLESSGRFDEAERASERSSTVLQRMLSRREK